MQAVRRNRESADNVLEAIHALPLHEGVLGAKMSGEVAWLIESKQEGTNSWWQGTRYGWKRDADNAVRFSREVDAVRLIESMGWQDSAFASQHAWIPLDPEAILRSIRNSLAAEGYVNKETDDGVLPERVKALLSETKALRQRENEFANVLEARDEQCNHAIRVNRNEVGREAYDRALADIGYTVSVGMIAAERRRQVEGESWKSPHDDGHTEGQLALAAACYALKSAGLASQHYRLGRGGIEVSVDALGIYWPFESAAWKPQTSIRNLVKAGALIAAEIDRRLRAGEEP